MNQKTTITVLAFVLVVVLVIRYFVTRKKDETNSTALIDVRGDLSPLPDVPVTSVG